MHSSADDQRNFDEIAKLAFHDLREPLRKIKSFSELIAQEKDALSTKQQMYLGRMTGAVVRMNAMLDGLEAYSEAGTSKEEKRLLSPNDIFSELLRLPSFFEYEKSIEIDPLHQIYAMPKAMRVLFGHILSNAIKFARQGEPVSVKVTSQAENKRVLILVKDNGIGFDQQIAKDIFLPFKKMHGHGENPGAGLGLSIAKKIMVQQGGDISAESWQGGGATFIMDFPDL